MYYAALRMRFALFVPALVVGLLACASDRAVTRLGDGHYRVRCALGLLECLEPVAKACEHGYTIVAAEERRELVGPNPNQTEVLKSNAELRCRQPAGLFGAEAAPSAAAVGGGAPSSVVEPSR
jgi:hypothetical protein